MQVSRWDRAVLTTASIVAGALIGALSVAVVPSRARGAEEAVCHQMECDTICDLLGCYRTCSFNTGGNTKCQNFGVCRTLAC
jgi:hypothetical protein